MSDKVKEPKKNRWLYSICIIAAVIFVIIAALITYRKGNINYYNSDATWHTLLTIKAYDETPVSQHLFLPIVSLGSEDDKWIPWGSTIPDSEGNYYYTSFSPAGYFLPWLFFKIFHLPVSESSLYLFNTFLFAVSAALWAFFLKKTFKKNSITILGVLLYVFSPELLHGMGAAYWHQSVMQVTLILQIIAYFRFKETGSKKWGALFFVMAVINPYIEWTGYVANGGFIIAELIKIKKENVKSTIIRILATGALTIVSFLLFTGHYLLRVSTSDFFEALKARFFARNVTANTELSSVIGGYFKSFAFIWVVFLVLIIWNIWRTKKIEIRHGWMLFVLVFPLMENILMKQHAVSYSYDRMKFIIFFSFLCCELIAQIDRCDKELKKRSLIWISIIVLACCGLNIYQYNSSSSYIWSAEYRSDNSILADYINENYADSVLGLKNASVRGYINLLFGRVIYERKDLEYITQKAKESGKQYAVVINVKNNQAWNMYELSGATVFDIENETTTNVYVNGGKVEEQAP